MNAERATESASPSLTTKVNTRCVVSGFSDALSKPIVSSAAT